MKEEIGAGLVVGTTASFLVYGLSLVLSIMIEETHLDISNVIWSMRWVLAVIIFPSTLFAGCVGALWGGLFGRHFSTVSSHYWVGFIGFGFALCYALILSITLVTLQL
jgi:hypothetical protein